jgi:hypothetical protein
MNKEEKEAIKYLDMMENKINFDLLGYVYGNETIDTILNLIQKQDKIIDMAMELIARKVGSRIEICPDMNCCKETEGNRTCKQCAIEYFKKEVKKDE